MAEVMKSQAVDARIFCHTPHDLRDLHLCHPKDRAVDVPWKIF
ncbi:unnamed protein product [Acidocella sp. C78]|nr:unnamed protein product [Acidocella sp. C78]